MALTKANNRMIDGAPINVLDYGADNTGVTECSSEIQAAISAAKELRDSTDVSSVSVYFPDGVYKITTALKIVKGVNLIGQSIHSVLILQSSTDICLYSAVYSSGTYTDNLDATTATAAGAQECDGCSITNMHFEHTGSSVGSSPDSSTAYEAIVQLNGFRSSYISNVRISSTVDNIGGFFIENSWSTRIEGIYCARGSGRTGGTALHLSTECNNFLVTRAQIFGDWEYGIRSTNPRSVTIIEPNVARCDIGIWMGGRCPRIIGGYFEANTTDIRMGTTGGTSASEFLIQNTYHDATSAIDVQDYCIDLANAQGGTIESPQFHTDTLFENGENASPQTKFKFRQRSSANGNQGNKIHLKASNAQSADLEKYGLGGYGNNIVEVIGVDQTDDRAYALYQTSSAATSDVFLELDPNVKGHYYQSFLLTIENDGGTIKHTISNGDGATSSSFADLINAASSSASTTPTINSGSGFTAGFGLIDGSLSSGLLDTGTQDPAAEFNFRSILSYNSSGTAILVGTKVTNSDIGGNTRNRPRLTFTNATTGAAFNITTGNIATGKKIEIRCSGWLKG